MSNIVNITKEGSFIIIALDDKPNPARYDCKEHRMYSYTGRAVKTFPSAIAKNSGTSMQDRIIFAICDALKGDTRRLRKIEMFFTVLDRVFGDVPDECPKGYIQWCIDNDKKINTNTLRTFKQEKAIASWTEPQRKMLTDIRDNSGYDVTDYILAMNDNQRQTFTKIYHTSLKTFCWNVARSMDRLCRMIRIFGNNWENFVDTNRNFEQNYTVLEEARDKERNDRLIANQQKIKAIESMSNEQFTIIVPVTLEAFTDEGKQQNNCVGHYYHDSIADGKNLIYFIRKTANPARSYITNRYNVGYGYTCETRKVNNSSNDDSKARALIKEIDKKIKELLGVA